MKKNKALDLFLTISIGITVIIILLIVLFKLIFNNIEDTTDYKPKLQTGTTWKCKNSDIEFRVIEHRCLGTMKYKKQTLNIILDFGPGRDTSIYVGDIHTDDFNKDRYNSTLIFRGDCRFSKSKCQVIVEESNIESIKVGDRITFIKQKQ